MKKIYKISINILMLGWFPFMILSVLSRYLSEGMNIFLFTLGILICMIGGLLSLTITTNNDFWKSLEELEQIKKEHKESIKDYNNAKNTLITKILEQEEQTMIINKLTEGINNLYNKVNK